MRWSSEVMTRRYFARSGTSSLQSFSTASAKPTLFMIERDVVQPVGVREALRPGHVLAALLEPAVQEADLELAVA